MSNITSWMSWEGGVDLCAITEEGLDIPNVIIHVARMVHTPVGSAPAGMILWQPHPGAAPEVMAFISPDAAVRGYFGPHIFKDTGFETAGNDSANITVNIASGRASSVVEIGKFTFEVDMAELGPLERINRSPGGMTPFTQDVLEAVAVAGTVTLKVNGAPVPIIIPPVGVSGGPAAVFAATGLYAR